MYEGIGLDRKEHARDGFIDDRIHDHGITKIVGNDVIDVIGIMKSLIERYYYLLLPLIGNNILYYYNISYDATIIINFTLQIL